MSVAPDLLLKSTPDVTPKATSKASAKPAEPNKNEASSFAQVYAKERQAKPAERSEASAKPNRETKEVSKEENPPQDVSAADQPAVAESGNPLPSDDPALEQAPVDDPLFLFGLTGQPLIEEEQEVVADPEEGAGGLSIPVVSPSLIGSGPASLTEASHDPELDALNQLPAVRMALEIGKAEQGAATSPVAQAVITTGQGFASAMAAMGLQQSQVQTQLQGEGAQGAEADISLLGLSGEAFEALKESSAETPAENFVSKLSALTQAINQQNPQVSRSAIVMPGQPIQMQQSGWSEAVVDRVMMLSSQNLKTAEIQLDPAELGRLEVRINLNQDQTQVTFASPNAGVREALEGQMHRLREMFTQQGMNLMDVNVSDQSLNRGWQGQDGDGKGGRGGASGGEAALAGEDEALQGVTEVRHTPSSGRGMVDFYA